MTVTICDKSDSLFKSASWGNCGTHEPEPEKCRFCVSFSRKAWKQMHDMELDRSKPYATIGQAHTSPANIEKTTRPK